MVRASKIVKETTKEEKTEIEFINATEKDVTFRNPTEAYGRTIPPGGGSTFTNVLVGQKVTLPRDKGLSLGLTPVSKLIAPVEKPNTD